MTYQLRDEKGILKLELNTSSALLLMDKIPGFFREARYKDGSKKTVYEITQDFTFDVGIYSLAIFLWAGDTLSKSGE